MVVVVVVVAYLLFSARTVLLSETGGEADGEADGEAGREADMGSEADRQIKR